MHKKDVHPLLKIMGTHIVRFPTNQKLAIQQRLDFLALPCDAPYVVKRPKLGSLSGDKLASAIANFTKAYRHEQLVWDLVYPNQKAVLVIEGGLRLILPRLPGTMLSESISNDPLIRCQQVLAVALALQQFDRLGWTLNDFNADNVLIKPNDDGTFRAYLIDFDGATKKHEFQSNTHFLHLNNMVYGIPSLRSQYYYSLDKLIADLLKEISSLSKVNQNTQTDLVIDDSDKSNQAIEENQIRQNFIALFSLFKPTVEYRAEKVIAAKIASLNN